MKAKIIYETGGLILRNNDEQAQIETMTTLCENYQPISKVKIVSQNSIFSTIYLYHTSYVKYHIHKTMGLFVTLKNTKKCV